eukprot:6214825-Pleurochrysis_carterae.AAC.2
MAHAAGTHSNGNKRLRETYDYGRASSNAEMDHPSYSMGKRVTRTQSELFDDDDRVTAWMHTLRKVKDFIHEHRGRRKPSSKSEDPEERRLERWIRTQRSNYATNASSSSSVMNNVEIRAEWARFMETHALLFEDHVTAWRRALQKAKDFFAELGRERLPSWRSEYAKEKRIVSWIKQQRYDYTRRANIMKDIAIREEWSKFVEAHPMLFEENEATAWRRRMLHEVEEQRSNYAYERDMMKKDVAIQQESAEFTEETHADVFDYGKKRMMAWRGMLRKVQEFVGGQGGERKPSRTSKNAEERSLAKWMSDQQAKYTSHAHIMKDTAIREEWANFVETHADLFHNKQRTGWRRTLRKLEEFLEERGGAQRRPSQTSENVEEKRLAKWVSHQQRNYREHAYIMKDADIREEWASFVDTHPVLFGYGVMAWRDMLRNVEEFIAKEGGKRKPSRYSKDAYEKRLWNWVNHQKTNYMKHAEIMQSAAIREEWLNFLEAHAALFAVPGDVLELGRWMNNYDEVMEDLKLFM